MHLWTNGMQKRRVKYSRAIRERINNRLWCAYIITTRHTTYNIECSTCVEERRESQSCHTHTHSPLRSSSMSPLLLRLLLQHMTVTADSFLLTCQAENQPYTHTHMQQQWNNNNNNSNSIAHHHVNMKRSGGRREWTQTQVVFPVKHDFSKCKTSTTTTATTATTPTVMKSLISSSDRGYYGYNVQVRNKWGAGGGGEERGCAKKT